MPVATDSSNSTRLKSSVSAVIMRTIDGQHEHGQHRVRARTSGGSGDDRASLRPIWRRGANNQLSIAHQSAIGAATS